MLLAKYELRTAEAHGCQFGFKDDDGTPVNKPWLIATNDDILFGAMNSRRCKGCKKHALCCGKLAKRIEGYTDEMAKVIHKAWQKSNERIQSKLVAPIKGADAKDEGSGGSGAPMAAMVV